MRTGIFGGTFDPPHLGHLILAEEACWQLDLRRVLFVLTPNPPHKREIPVTQAEVRLELLTRALQGKAGFSLSRVDLDRPPPHYAVDTVKLLRGEMPGETWVYLMGGDSLRDLPTWHHPEDFIAACDEIGVMCRPDARVDLTALEARLPGLTQKVRFIEVPLLEISSSDLRRRIAQGQPYRNYLPEAVWKMIQSQRLYLG